MFLLRKPSDTEIRSFISAQQRSHFSYSPLEVTRSSAPAGYNADHNRVQLGTGAQCFTAAVTAIRQWKMFDFDWVRLYWDHTPIEPGATLAVVVKHLGIWSMNACRIVYVIDERERYGFAYGTLAEHAEKGEERFMIEWNRDDDTVWYDLLAVSKPRLAATLGYPYTRHLQKRFAQDSKRAMKRAVR
jgi:uncharacterized protein (UPF0548 family)